MNIVTSPDARGTVKTMLIRFQSAEALSSWESSPQRQILAADADHFFYVRISDRARTRDILHRAGRDRYAGTTPLEDVRTDHPGGLPAREWRALSSVLFDSKMARWPAAVRLLPVIAVMTLLLTYVCLPALSKLFAPWLSSPPARARKQIS